MDKVRVDKWLWSVRILKSRSLATNACDKGRVKLKDEKIKPSKQIVVGDELIIRIKQVERKIKVLKLIQKRVGASVAAECYEELARSEEVSKEFRSAFYQLKHRSKGSGRPTKKERRNLDNLNFDTE